MLNPVQDEASRIAYQTGIRELAPLVRRLIALENIVANQEIKIAALQSAALQLKYPKNTVAGSVDSGTF